MDKDKLYNEAMDDLNNDKYDEALKKYISLFNSNFDDRSVFYYILNCIELCKEEDIRDAIENIKLDNTNPDSLFIKSYALNSVEEYEDAVKYIEDAIQLNPNNFHYHLLKMTEYVDLGKVEESESYLEGMMETNQIVFVKILLFNMFIDSVDEDFEGDLFEIIEYIDNFEDEYIEDFINKQGGIEGLLNQLESGNLQVELDEEGEINLDGDNVIHIDPEDVDENGNITLKLDDNIDIEVEEGSGIEHDEEGNLVINVNDDIEEGEEELEISFPYQFIDENEVEELNMEEIQEALTIAHSQFRYNEDHSDYILSQESEECIYNSDEEIIEVIENYIKNTVVYINDFISKIKDKDMADFLRKNIELIENRKFDEALDNTNDYFLKNPDDKNIMIFKGFLYHLNFLSIDALYIINQIKDNENIYECMLIKALACEALNRDLSYYCFEKVLEMDDNDERIWVEYIIYALNKEDMAKVEQLASKCKAKFPDFEMGIEEE